MQTERNQISSIIEGLDSLRDDVRNVVEDLQTAEVYPPDLDVDDSFDEVIDMLNNLDRVLKNDL